MRADRSPLRRRLRARLADRLLGLSTRFLGGRSWSGAQRIGRALGGLAWQVARRDRRRALDHLALAFPELEEGERRRLARACFRHHGTTLGECLYLMTRDCAEVARRVEVEGWEGVVAARAAGRAILIVTGHCGNWELLAAALNCRGLDMSVVARTVDEPELQKWLVGLRSRFGTPTIERGTPGAPRRLLASLRGGGALGMLIDQDTRIDGDWVPFFGRLAYTPLGAAKVALRQGAAVIPTFIERLPDGSHRAVLEAPLELPDDALAATARMTERIEAQVRRRPEQWVWMHRRWRRQPPPEALPAVKDGGEDAVEAAEGAR